MKRNLEEELKQISNLPIGFDSKGDYAKFYLNDLCELFSKTCDEIIGGDEDAAERNTIVRMTRNICRRQQRTRKKELIE
jgi:hypothetical protein